MSGYKNPGNFFGKKSYNENAYQLEELFSPNTVSILKNSSLVQLIETKSIYIGRCFTICTIIKFGKKFGPTLELKKDFDFKAFIHVAGFEFWLNGVTEYPLEIPSTVLDVNNSENVIAAFLSVAEIESTFLNKKNFPCKSYAENVGNDNDLFVDCCKEQLLKNFPVGVACKVETLINFTPNNSTLEECQNVEAADKTIAMIKGRIKWHFVKKQFYISQFVIFCFK